MTDRDHEYPIPQHEDGRYMADGRLSWGVIGRESFAGFLGGAAFRHLRSDFTRILADHALTAETVGPGYPVCACGASLHDAGDHRAHVAEQLIEGLATL